MPTAPEVLKYIPLSYRMPVAMKLASMLDGIVKRNNDKLWDCIFRFCSCCLWLPKRGNIDGVWLEMLNNCFVRKLIYCLPPSLANSVLDLHMTSLNPWLFGYHACWRVYRGAVSLTCSEDSIVELDQVTLAALQSKHPPPNLTCVFLHSQNNMTRPFRFLRGKLPVRVAPSPMSL